MYRTCVIALALGCFATPAVAQEILIEAMAQQPPVPPEPPGRIPGVADLILLPPVFPAKPFRPRENFAGVVRAAVPPRKSWQSVRPVEYIRAVARPAAYQPVPPEPPEPTEAAPVVQEAPAPPLMPEPADRVPAEGDAAVESPGLPKIPEQVESVPVEGDAATKRTVSWVLPSVPQANCGYSCGSPYCISDACPSPEMHGSACGSGCRQLARPFGSYMRAYTSAQVAKGIAGRMVLYHYDFHNPQSQDAAQLVSRGKWQLWKIATWMQHHPYSVIVERSRSNPDLDEARRVHVVAELKKFDIGDAAERVLVARPFTRGIEGVEAIPMYNNRLFQTQSSGAFPLRGLEANE